MEDVGMLGNFFKKKLQGSLNTPSKPDLRERKRQMPGYLLRPENVCSLP